MNIQPTPARAVVVDLETLEPKIYDFTGNVPVME
jgi:DNA polymerase II small subunit